MLNRRRLFLGVVAACAGTLIPFLSANAQSAIGAQAFAEMNQVQQALNSGLLTPDQANDLINRYNDIIARDQQWSMQYNGAFNSADRLDLQRKLQKTSLRFQNNLQANGVMINGNLNGGFLPYMAANNGSAWSRAGRRHCGGATGPGYMDAYGTPYGNPYASPYNNYGAPVVYPSPYNNLGTYPVGYNMFPANLSAGGGWKSGIVQGLLNQLGNGGALGNGIPGNGLSNGIGGILGF